MKVTAIAKVVEHHYEVVGRGARDRAKPSYGTTEIAPIASRPADGSCGAKPIRSTALTSIGAPVFAPGGWK